MSYKTLQGYTVKHPFELQAAATKLQDEKFREQAIKYSSEIQRMYESLTSAENELIKLRGENQRLHYENEFMLKIINLSANELDNVNRKETK